MHPDQNRPISMRYEVICLRYWPRLRTTIEDVGSIPSLAVDAGIASCAVSKYVLIHHHESKLNLNMGNCKCDEAKPHCVKCVKYGVACNYTLPTGCDLQLAKEHKLETSPDQISFGVQPLKHSLQSFAVVGAGPDSFVLEVDGLARLSRFQTHTVYTFATLRSTELYKNEVVRMAMEVSRLIHSCRNVDMIILKFPKHPFLMHVIQVITATHDRLLANPGNGKRSLVEAYHWSRGAALLNEKIASPIRPQDRDALWASAAMLGIANVTSLEASTPTEAWPMKPDDLSDLTWLHLTRGKMALWEATDPLRPDSIFHFMKDEYVTISTEPCLLEAQSMLPGFVELCRLDEPLACDRNPYYSAVSILSQVLPIKCTRATMKNYLVFLSFMKVPFRNLLHQKDPRALLVMAHWYGAMWESLWWIERRARLECQAICLYLERCHGNERDIQNMLLLPRIQCGFA
ncbi:hypothetical protein N7509_007178 [Penicillium cosmopolitanum]|uniref:Zn(2)-C6 fungal-type domain-containing protein n=1 Tax=Penicillium cosmopolitanum TaxID=1131564 RepID=A0A9X0B889_9EURO|nr:uncharacterized protein N7509_007178 [Penicillium cosmopolitanum]KAJ5391688.1 hypothetical protein N7509_007178 [Penicillium cosmopolitanum]